MYKITYKRYLNPQVVQMKILAPRIASKAQAGQFIILCPNEKSERIPLTINDSDVQTGEITIIYQMVGATTKFLGTLETEEYISDIAGPLGRPSELEGYNRAVVIGGGLGCAIAYPQAKKLHRLGCKTDIIAGFRSSDLIILEDEMKEQCNKLIVTTDDGSNGNKGFVTDALRSEITNGAEYELAVVIGPAVMMKFVAKLTEEYKIKTMVSLNPIMIDGTGMCGGCRVTVGGKVKFACVDGPDFDGHQVNYDELITRNKSYIEAENHACRMFGEINKNA